MFSDSRIQNFKKRIEGIFRVSRHVSVILYAATKENYYRKPAPGMYELFKKSFLGDSFAKKLLYIGDAAGRPATEKRKKDYSDIDVKFSININAEFQVPEQYFLGIEENVPIPIHPSALLNQIEQNSIPLEKECKQQEIIMMVGLPCSGKTTIAKRLFPDYYLLELDKNKSTLHDQMNKEFIPMLEQGKSIILDGCNSSLFGRKYFLQKKNKVTFKCILIDCPPKMAIHMDAMRAHLTDSRRIQNWDQCIERFSKPSIKEGFDDLVRIPFEYNGNNQELFRIFLV